MKFKRILAAALAGVMAMTGMVVTSVTASAETTWVESLPYQTTADNSAWYETVYAVSADDIKPAETTLIPYLYFAYTSSDATQWGTQYEIKQQDSSWTSITGCVNLGVASNSTPVLIPYDAATMSNGIYFTGWNINATEIGLIYELGSTAVSFTDEAGWTNQLTVASTDIPEGAKYVKIDYTSCNTSEWGSQYQIYNNSWTDVSGCVNLSVASTTASVYCDISSCAADGFIMKGWNISVSNLTFYGDVPTPTTYTITTTAPTNGTLSVDKATAAEGETVTVTATPATGYTLDKITVNGTAITGTTFTMPAEAVTVAAAFTADAAVDVLESGTYTDGTWEEISADELAAAGTLNTNTTVGDGYLTTTGVLSVQYNTTEKKLRIYQVYEEAALNGKNSASIIVKKGDVALKLTTECVYTTLAEGQTAPDGCYYIAWVISGVDDPTAFSYSSITLA